MSRLLGVVLAGGRGSRLRPISDRCPKPLLPIAGEPLLALQLRRLAAAGITEVAIATGYLGDRFEPMFGDGSRLGLRCIYSWETTPLGTGGALVAAAAVLRAVPGDTLVVLNGDQLTEHDLTAQLQRFETARVQAGAGGSVHARTVQDVRAFGLLGVESGGGEDLLVSFEEKPSRACAGLVNAGTYVVDPVLLQDFPRHTHLSFERDVLPQALSVGRVVTVFHDERAGRDIGTPDTFRRANVEAVTNSGRSALIDTRASVAADAVVTGGSYVGAGATVAAGAFVSGSVILGGAVVHEGARLTDCVVTWDAHVDPGSTYNRGVIGS
ncbi:nucleotidyltransferase family protein [Rudaeicoccus suwonensis]|uniref:Nucleotidyltransferase n=1 Tax=Rudaeicoccus suwonensis TaxID=657409 RepID=A0A561EAI3_9MICO|nr:NDP-sugar synthase [Rudaeicoccus suwonensis]TWE12623.1 nucleotidyltransferase [Rudaeicoccus suwonensis]